MKIWIARILQDREQYNAPDDWYHVIVYCNECDKAMGRFGWNDIGKDTFHDMVRRHEAYHRTGVLA